MALSDAPAETRPQQLRVEVVQSETPQQPEPQPQPGLRDIEHAYVVDDPREWPRSRKVGIAVVSSIPLLMKVPKIAILFIIAIASMIATLGANIYNRKCILQLPGNDIYRNCSCNTSNTI